MVRDQLLKFLESEKFIWVQFAWLLWTTIRHIAIFRIPWCIFSSVLKLIFFWKWESPIVYTRSGPHLAIIGRRDWQNDDKHEMGKAHPELQQGDCDAVAEDTYQVGIYGMTFVCNGKCLDRVVQACLYGTESTWACKEDGYTGRVEGFYELTNEIASGIYVVEEISQAEFLRRIVEGKARFQLDSTEWWVTGYHDHPLIFRSKWSMLKTESRLYNSLPIIPIFLTSRFNRFIASVACLTLIIIDLLLPLTSSILNLFRYLAKTRLQLLISRVGSCKVRRKIFAIMSGFRPGMKPCLDKANKVVRLKEIHIIVFPTLHPVCYPFSCVQFESGMDPIDLEHQNPSRKELQDGSVIVYSRQRSRNPSRWIEGENPPKPGECLDVTVLKPLSDPIRSLRNGSLMRSLQLKWMRRPDLVDVPVPLSTVKENTVDEDEEIGVHTPLRSTRLEQSYEVEKNWKQEDYDPGRKSFQGDAHPVAVKAKYKLKVALERKMTLTPNERPNSEQNVDGQDNAKIWEVEIDDTEPRRTVLEYYLRNMEITFCVEACNSRMMGREICVQPKTLFDTVDYISNNPHCLLLKAEGPFLVGPSIPKNGLKLCRTL
ncbi:hypothetical protein Mapa_015683 [Marchantia paleacea]|nr:hypothetical protein Mapa_015683 [Marchantia paleacea]